MPEKIYAFGNIAYNWLRQDASSVFGARMPEKIIWLHANPTFL
jgi:hypothetical protein